MNVFETIMWCAIALSGIATVIGLVFLAICAFTDDDYQD